MQALRALVRLEAEVKAVQVMAQLVPVPMEALGVPAHRGEVTVTYELTERGRALMPALDQIAQWARDNLPPEKC